MKTGSRSGTFGSSHFIVAIVIATLAMTGLALVLRNTGSSLAAAILGLYLLHLLSVRFILEAQRHQQTTLFEQFEHLHQLLGTAPVTNGKPHGAAPRGSGRGGRPRGDDGSGEGGLDALLGRAARAAGAPRLAVPRHFALGTVAIIRRTLSPADVAKLLIEQERRPGARFGDVAVELGLLTEAQLRELLVAQQEGLFDDRDIRDAKRRIERFREGLSAVSAA